VLPPIFLGLSFCAYTKELGMYLDEEAARIDDENRA